MINCAFCGGECIPVHTDPEPVCAHCWDNWEEACDLRNGRSGRLTEAVDDPYWARDDRYDTVDNREEDWEKVFADPEYDLDHDYSMNL